MSIFGSGTQSDWYAAGMLLMQLAFLVAGVWFANSFLKAIRGFQEQVGALVKLSVTSEPAEPHEASTLHRSVPAKAESAAGLSSCGGGRREALKRGRASIVATIESY